METEQYSFITVAVVLREQPEKTTIAAGGLVSSIDNPRVNIFELARLDDPWPTIIDKAARLAHGPDFDLQRAGNAMELVVDNSAGTSAVLEQLLDIEDVGCLPVILTTERSERTDGMSQYLPVRDVAGALQKAHQSRTLEIAKSLPLAAELEVSLGNLTIREAENADPLVLAAALVVH